jgi:parallel beta-helix repeat protein
MLTHAIDARSITFTGPETQRSAAMNRLTISTVVLVATATAYFLSGTAAQQETPVAGLPGARPTIDAAAFSSLQAAIDALPDRGGLVRLPPGDFVIHEPLRVRTQDVCLEGCGTATHIQNANTDGQPALLIAHPVAPAEGKRPQPLWRVRLADLRITGNASSGAGIEARHVNEIFIDGVTVSENGGDGILLDLCYEDPRVCDSLITYNKGVGLNLQGCHDIVVAANQFEENQDALHCVDGFNLCMTGNCLDDHLGNGVVIENTYGSVVSGNMIEECQAMAIILDRDCYGITLSANVIAHNGGGIDLRDAHGCAVSANTFTIMKSDALRIASESGRISVAGNSFCNSYIGAGQLRRGTDDLQAAGLVLDGTQSIGISGNVFSGVRPKAVHLTDAPSRKVALVGNVLTDVESDHEQLIESEIRANVMSD